MTSSGVVSADISSPEDGGDNHEDRLLLQEDHQKASLEYVVHSCVSLQTIRHMVKIYRRH